MLLDARPATVRRQTGLVDALVVAAALRRVSNGRSRVPTRGYGPDRHLIPGQSRLQDCTLWLSSEHDEPLLQASEFNRGLLATIRSHWNLERLPTLIASLTILGDNPVLHLVGSQGDVRVGISETHGHGVSSWPHL